MPSPFRKIWDKLKPRPLLPDQADPVTHRHGRIGELAARDFLQKNGLVFLAAHYAARRGEIDLVFRDQTCLVFVEVKTRTSELWVRPAAAVNQRKRKLLSKAALEYLRKIKYPQVAIRFDIVEVLLNDCEEVREIRHLPNCFSLSKPYRYG